LNVIAMDDLGGYIDQVLKVRTARQSYVVRIGRNPKIKETRIREQLRFWSFLREQGVHAPTVERTLDAPGTNRTRAQCTFGGMSA
jgi:Ser/Thr protein kinase RdoA (MazF antagonist)